MGSSFFHLCPSPPPASAPHAPHSRSRACSTCDVPPPRPPTHGLPSGLWPCPVVEALGCIRQRAARTWSLSALGGRGPLPGTCRPTSPCVPATRETPAGSCRAHPGRVQSAPPSGTLRAERWRESHACPGRAGRGHSRSCLEVPGPDIPCARTPGGGPAASRLSQAAGSWHPPGRSCGESPGPLAGVPAGGPLASRRLGALPFALCTPLFIPSPICPPRSGAVLGLGAPRHR